VLGYFFMEEVDGISTSRFWASGKIRDLEISATIETNFSPGNLGEKST